MDMVGGDTLAVAPTDEGMLENGVVWALAFDERRELLYSLSSRGSHWQLVVREAVTLRTLGVADLGAINGTLSTAPYLFVDRGPSMVHALVPNGRGAVLHHVKIPQ
jgi:hypothetical protein